MSDTPRTDHIEFESGGMSRTEAVKWARQLERELAEEVALHRQTQRLLAEGLAENISLKRSIQSLEDHDYYQRGVDGR